MQRSPNAPRMRASLAACLFWLACSAHAAPAPYQDLPQAKLAELKNKPCALFHLWATWCIPCIDELPKFLAFIAKQKGITPVVIDISEPFVQDNFSKKWLKQLAPPFTTYLKPKGDAHSYLEAIEKPWPNSLPYNALFARGKRKGKWVGTQDFEKLGPEMTRLCR